MLSKQSTEPHDNCQTQPPLPSSIHSSTLKKKQAHKGYASIHTSVVLVHTACVLIGAVMMTLRHELAVRQLLAWVGADPARLQWQQQHGSMGYCRALQRDAVHAICSMILPLE
jgi:hypothetical protein